MINTVNTFGEWLNKELTERGWSQRELGRQAGISGAIVSEVINGRPPGWGFCAAIARPLEKTPLEVFQLAGLLPGGSHRLKESLAQYYASSLTPEEASLLETYRRLDRFGQKAVQTLAEGLAVAPPPSEAE